MPWYLMSKSFSRNLTESTGNSTEYKRTLGEDGHRRRFDDDIEESGLLITGLVHF